VSIAMPRNTMIALGDLVVRRAYAPIRACRQLLGCFVHFRRPALGFFRGLRLHLGDVLLEFCGGFRLRLLFGGGFGGGRSRGFSALCARWGGGGGGGRRGRLAGSAGERHENEGG